MIPRFEIGDISGVKDFCWSKEKAFREAEKMNTNYMYVFDRMAHIGAPELWTYKNGNWFVTIIKAPRREARHERTGRSGRVE